MYTRVFANSLTYVYTLFLVAALVQNYIFASLNEADLQELALAMETVQVSGGENIIAQGKQYITKYKSLKANEVVFVYRGERRVFLCN
jgi:hypothetical protein